MNSRCDDDLLIAQIARQSVQRRTDSGGATINFLVERNPSDLAGDPRGPGPYDLVRLHPREGQRVEFFWTSAKVAIAIVRGAWTRVSLNDIDRHDDFKASFHIKACAQ